MPPRFPAIVPGTYRGLEINDCFGGRWWREGSGTCFYEIAWATDWGFGVCEVGS